MYIYVTKTYEFFFVTNELIKLISSIRLKSNEKNSQKNLKVLDLRFLEHRLNS